MKLHKSVKIVLFISAVLIVGLLAKELVLKKVVSMGASRAFGAKVTIERLSWHPLRKRLSLEGIKIFNPKDFPDELFLDVSTFDVAYTHEALRQDQPHLDLVVMDVKEVVVIKNKEGLLNVNQLKVAQESSEQENSKTELPVQVDLLKLNVDHLVYKDYYKKDPAVVKTFDIGIKDKEFKNVDGPQKLVALVLANALRRTTIKGVKMYALFAFLGPTFLPAGITASILVGKDHADGEFDVSFEKAYSSAVSVLQNIGEVKSENIEDGKMEAAVSGHQVFINIERKTESSVKITASARKLKLPRAQFAGGILYQISKEFEQAD